MRRIIVLTVLLSLCLGCSFPSYDLESSRTPSETFQTEEASPIVSPSETSPPPIGTGTGDLSYIIVDTGQQLCFDSAAVISCPQQGEAFFGQDAQYSSASPRYVDNGDGTVSDLQTGLMWQQGVGDKVTFSQALTGAESFDLAGYSDWRLPTIKELYSLIDFSGTDPSGWDEKSNALRPFIDTTYFEFNYGDTAGGERIIDAQFWSSSEYTATTMFGSATTFGVNFADGRIKGYGRENPRGEMTQYVRYVRGNSVYGENDFLDNDDGTITDRATGLTWMQDDSGEGMYWEDALTYCENLEWATYDDWRLPNAKELQSIVDYGRSPLKTDSAAIDPLFVVSQLLDEAGDIDYPYYWTSTTHVNQMMGGGNAVYIAFGKAMGFMQGTWIDVHGAGAQRSDPKSGEPSDYPEGHGPQGDAIRIHNYVRCVRGGVSSEIATGDVTGPGDTTSEPPPAVNAAAPPPQEAVDACVGLAQDSACEIDTPDGIQTGTCTLIAAQLACFPAAGPPAGPPGGP